MLMQPLPVPVQDAAHHEGATGQQELSVNELAELTDTIMLSQASVQSVLAEVDSDRHNAEVLPLRSRPSAPPQKEKKKPELCKWGKKAKSCRSPCSWSGNGYWGATKG